MFFAGKFLKFAKFLLFFSIFFLLNSSAQAISNIQFNPELDISLFTPYNLTADVTASPSSVILEVAGINNDANHPDQNPTCWNYNVAGECYSDTINLEMNYQSANQWQSANIYPDYIYPEIFFAPSETTWNNLPSSMDIWRRSYHLMKFVNPFTMVPNMSFWIELFALPNNLNSSANLQVYVVEGDVALDYFTSDWREKAQTALVGTFNRDQTVHHTHVDNNSSHYLVPLSADGTSLINGLDLSDSFWIILYQDSVNVNRGWNLKYHDSSLCTNSAAWYVGDRSGGGTWNTPLYQNGCPDVHIHLARRAQAEGDIITNSIKDGVLTTITAYYADSDPVAATQEFYYNELPNLAPNSTEFINPVVGSSYADNNLTISWNPTTDPNNDSLIYSIYLLNAQNEVLETLLSNSTNSSFVWDLSLVSDGFYSLKGEVIEAEGESPLSTDFYLDGTFHIYKEATIYSLTTISILSNNLNSASLAKAGDLVSLSFNASGDITPTVSFASGGEEIDSARITVSEISNNNFIASYEVLETDSDGTVSFEITADNLDQIYFETSDDSLVEVDNTAPETPIANPGAGTYSEAQTITLSSSGSESIYYTIELTEPSCGVGTLYQSALDISSATTLKAVACDQVGNSSSLLTVTYLFQDNEAEEPSSEDEETDENNDSTSTNISNPSSSTNTPTCTDLAPIGQPEIFQSQSSSNSITLFFTPLLGIDQYYLSYSRDPLAEEHGIELSLTDHGVLQYQVNFLDANTIYYFKVRGQNGCMPGKWSSIKSASTLASPSFLSNNFAVQDRLNIKELSIEENLEACSYTVKSGDTLWGIASKLYGDGSLYTLLIKENLDKYPNIEKNLSINWQLDLPCEAPEEKGNEINQKQFYDLLVKVQINGQVQSFVDVELHSEPRLATTDENGEVFFEDVERGEHVLIIKQDKQKIEQKITVDGEAKHLNIVVDLELSESKVWPRVIWILLTIVALLSFYRLIIYRRNQEKK